MTIPDFGYLLPALKAAGALDERDIPTGPTSRHMQNTLEEATRSRLSSALQRDDEIEELRREQTLRDVAQASGPQDPAEMRAELGQQIKETGPQLARGLAESGYATALGVSELAGVINSEAPLFEKVDAIRESRDEMREFYGEPETGPGMMAQLAGELAGTAAQFMIPGSVATRAGLISRGAPITTQVAANVSLGVPIDMIQGASERERSIAGVLADQAGLESLDDIADSPLKRALFEGLAGGVLSVVGDLPTVVRGFSHPLRATFGEVSPEDFNRALTNFARVKPDYQGFITWRTPDEMRQEGMKMYITPDGRAGYAVAPDGDMRNLFTTPGSPSGTGAYGVAHAISQGGTKGDAFDTQLMKIYKDFGAVEDWRMQWDDTYRPEGWREDIFGKPDVVGFTIPESNRGLSADELFDMYDERRAARGKPRYGTPPASVLDDARRLLFGDERGMAGEGMPTADTWNNLRRLRMNLQPDELAWAESRGKNLARIAGLFDELPDTKDFAAAALAGQVKRGWYRRSSEALVDSFGPDAPRFAAVLASLSPQTSVEMNLENALRVWNGWNRAGRPRDPDAIIDLVRTNISAKSEDMTSWTNNLQRALIEDDPLDFMLSGPKVDSFMRNLVDDVNSVTLDTWMGKFAGIEQSFFRGRAVGRDVYGTTTRKSGKYMAYSAKVRDTADYLTKLTGDTWTPEQVQETVWSWSKALEEGAGFDIRAVNDEMLSEVPDIGGLMQEDRYKSLLEQGGMEAPLPFATAGQHAPIDIAPDKARLQASAQRIAGMSGKTAGDFGSTVTPLDEVHTRPLELTEQFKPEFGEAFHVAADQGGSIQVAPFAEGKYGIVDSQVAPEVRGTGVGANMYMDAAREAEKRGGLLFSDVELSVSARRLWDNFVDRGMAQVADKPIQSWSRYRMRPESEWPR